MSLLARHLDAPLRTLLSARATRGGVRLDDVIRSGVRHPDSAIGVYAPDAESYEVFRELFDPILREFEGEPLSGRDIACLNPVAVVSTRMRAARNLSGHPFPARMSGAQRFGVRTLVERACEALADQFPGWVRELDEFPRRKLDAMIAARLAFGPGDKYMAAGGILAGWPAGRAVFITRNRQLSVWINEEDHLRVGVVLPGACIAACGEIMRRALSCLAAELDFSLDARRGHLTSCPSNVGSGLRASYMVDVQADVSQAPRVAPLVAAGILQVRGPDGEHSRAARGVSDLGFLKRVGMSQTRLLHDMERLVVRG